MYKVSKKPWYVLIFLVWGLLVGFLFWLTRDEPLSKEAELLLANVQLYDASITEHPYFDVLGFDARSDADQQILGHLKYQEGWSEFFNHFFDLNREAVNQPSKKLEGVFFNEDEAKSLDLIRNSSKQNLSYKQYQNHRLELQNLYRNNSILVQRYERLLKLENPKNILLLSLHSGTPNFILMTKVHHLYLAQLAFKNDLNGIAQNTHTLIAKTENVPLLDKMVYLSIISNNLDILNDLRLLNLHMNIEINQFNQKQLSIRNALSAEVGSISEVVNLINEHEKLAEFYSLLLEKNESETLKTRIKNKFAHFFFLKNASLNLYVSNVYPAIHKSELSNINLMEVLKNQKDVEVKQSGIKNYLGQRIIGIALPQWGSYAVRPRLVNQKIQVFNVLSKNREFDLKQLNQNTDGYEYYRTETELCIKSPDPNQDEEELKKYKSCLRI